ncbi:hypothetical protein Tco_0801689 [Tanacetum coccineum]|uniref:Uncharacterized protein n=1 Tax=Tanacetum coccineum TaxID=301880 RepID=A0ABQ4ZYZ8_9ASTR
MDTTPRYKNDNQTGQFRNQRAVNVAGARETVGGQVVHISLGYSVLTARIGSFANGMAESQYGFKSSNVQKEKMLLCKQDEKVSKSISKSRQAYNVMTNNINHLKEIVDQAWVKHSNDRLHLRNPTAQDMEILVKTCLMPLALKTQNDSFAFVHELKQEMHADLKYVESLEDEIDELESDKAEFSNMYDMLLQECVSNDIMCSYLQSSSDLDEITELQCLYLHKVRECDCLAQKLSEQTEFVSKEIYTKLLRSFAKLEKHLISLEIALQQCQEQLKNDTVCKEKASNVFRKEHEQYFEIQDLKAQL